MLLFSLAVMRTRPSGANGRTNRLCSLMKPHTPDWTTTGPANVSLDALDGNQLQPALTQQEGHRFESRVPPGGGSVSVRGDETEDHPPAQVSVLCCLRDIVSVTSKNRFYVSGTCQRFAH